MLQGVRGIQWSSFPTLCWYTIKVQYVNLWVFSCPPVDFGDWSSWTCCGWASMVWGTILAIKSGLFLAGCFMLAVLSVMEQAGSLWTVRPGSTVYLPGMGRSPGQVLTPMPNSIQESMHSSLNTPFLPSTHCFSQQDNPTVQSALSLKCLYINAHSMRNKQEELWASTQCQSYDIIDISKTGCDESCDWGATVDNLGSSGGIGRVGKAGDGGTVWKGGVGLYGTCSWWRHSWEPLGKDEEESK